jgi:hypothetical protein
MPPYRWLRVSRPTAIGLTPRLPHVLVTLRPQPPHAPLSLRLDHLASQWLCVLTTSMTPRPHAPMDPSRRLAHKEGRLEGTCANLGYLQRAENTGGVERSGHPRCCLIGKGTKPFPEWFRERYQTRHEAAPESAFSLVQYNSPEGVDAVATKASSFLSLDHYYS